MKTVLVTGGLGYIGSHTVVELVESRLIGEIPKGVPNYLFPFITQTVFGQREN